MERAAPGTETFDDILYKKAAIACGDGATEEGISVAPTKADASAPEVASFSSPAR